MGIFMHSDDGGERNKKWPCSKEKLLRNATTFVSRDYEQSAVESSSHVTVGGIFVHPDDGGEKNKKWTPWKEELLRNAMMLVTRNSE